MYSFGSSVQDEEGNVVLNFRRRHWKVIKFVEGDVVQESMTSEVFTWDASSNNRLMLTVKGSLTMNAVSDKLGQAEKDYPEMAKEKYLVSPENYPKDQVRRMGLQNVINVYSIWKFAESVEGAKKFIVRFMCQISGLSLFGQ